MAHGLIVTGKKDKVSGIVIKNDFVYELMKSGDWQKTGAVIDFTWIDAYGKIAVLVDMQGAHYLFKSVKVLERNEVQEFQGYAQEFGRNNQRTGSVSMQYNNKTLEFVDIGMAEHEEHGKMRFILAKSPEYVLVCDYQNDRDFILMDGEIVEDDAIESVDVEAPPFENPFVCKFCGVKFSSIVSPCPACGAP